MKLFKIEDLSSDVKVIEMKMFEIKMLSGDKCLYAADIFEAVQRLKRGGADMVSIRSITEKEY